MNYLAEEEGHTLTSLWVCVFRVYSSKCCWHCVSSLNVKKASKTSNRQQMQTTFVVIGALRAKAKQQFIWEQKFKVGK